MLPVHGATDRSSGVGPAIIHGTPMEPGSVRLAAPRYPGGRCWIGWQLARQQAVMRKAGPSNTGEAVHELRGFGWFLSKDTLKTTHNLIDKNHLFWYCSHSSTGIVSRPYP